MVFGIDDLIAGAAGVARRAGTAKGAPPVVPGVEGTGIAPDIEVESGGAVTLDVIAVEGDILVGAGKAAGAVREYANAVGRTVVDEVLRNGEAVDAADDGNLRARGRRDRVARDGRRSGIAHKYGVAVRG